jgi:NAD(P)H-dependent FMN reductase
MLNLKIIIGSTRPTRMGDLVAPWVIKRTNDHGAFDVEVLDLRDWPLPLFQEHMGTIGDFADPTYSEPIVRKWNQTLKAADALLIVTPSWALRNKPLAMVGYSIGISAGVRAVEHLTDVAIESEMVPLRDTVLIPKVQDAFDDAGAPVDPMTDIAMTVMLDDLEWWGTLLARARREGELAPGSLRVRAALAQLAGE